VFYLLATAVRRDMPEQAELEKLVRRLIEFVRADPPKFDQPATPEGAQLIAAVAALLRATRLLEDALGCADRDADEALLLVVRTLVEVEINARYLLANGRDGLNQLVANQERQRLKVANALFGPNDQRVQDLQATIQKAGLPPVKSIELLAKDSPGGTLAYNGIYRWLSNTAVHGGAASWERYWARVGDHLRGLHHPKLDPGRQEMLATAALVVGGLATAVCAELELVLPDDWAELAAGLDRYANQ
jgi:hypothetical protein